MSSMPQPLRTPVQRLQWLSWSFTLSVFVAAVALADRVEAAGAPAPAPKLVTPPAVSAVLSIDLGQLPNYAKPVLPVHYDAAVLQQSNAPAGNPVTNAGATLGRVLFWDRQLSVNNTVACASCHQQANGFGDPARFSTGVFRQTGTAHAMGLANAGLYRSGQMFWDKRAASLEAQATQPIINPVEMGYTASSGGLATLVGKLQGLAYYPPLFTAAFGDPAITVDRLGRALAQFERAMVSADSRWDQGYAQVYDARLPDKNLAANVPGLSTQENRGRLLFMTAPQNGGAGCAGCHQPPTFALAANSRSNGLDAGETRVFKSVSLKSITPGQPMMHDGRFTTFEQVIAHYSHSVKAGPALDARLAQANGSPRVPNFSSADAAALAAFLRTLNDTSLQTDSRFGNPFKR